MLSHPYPAGHDNSSACYELSFGPEEWQSRPPQEQKTVAAARGRAAGVSKKASKKPQNVSPEGYPQGWGWSSWPWPPITQILMMLWVSGF